MNFGLTHPLKILFDVERTEAGMNTCRFLTIRTLAHNACSSKHHTLNKHTHTHIFFDVLSSCQQAGFLQGHFCLTDTKMVDD
jgi:hypothetical protein